MNPKLLTLCLLLACSVLPARAAVTPDSVSGKVFQGFSGGMMLHGGYLFGVDKAAPIAPDGLSYSPEGGIFGFGGAMRVHLWKYLRTGFEGYVSTMYSGMMHDRDLLQPGSYVRVGCGGLNADVCWRLEKVWPYIGPMLQLRLTTWL